MSSTPPLPSDSPAPTEGSPAPALSPAAPTSPGAEHGEAPGADCLPPESELPEPSPLATARRGMTPVLWTTVVAVGALALLVSFTASARGDAVQNLSYRTGLILGAMTIWPLIVIGLFSLGRRFRGARPRALILTTVWGVMMLSQLGNLVGVRGARLGDRPPGKGGAPFTLDEMSLSDDGRQTDAETDGVAATVADTAAAREIDFSPGSDARLIERVSAAQQSLYRQVASGYRAACAARPDDAALALEWVRFAQHFAEAEEVEIVSARADFEAARAHLDERFPKLPGTVLLQLERAFGAEFTKQSARHAVEVSRWPPADAAKFHLLQAQRTVLREQSLRVQAQARLSFDLVPTPEAGILLAQGLAALQQADEALAVLAHPAFGTAPDWIEKQRMELFFDLNRVPAALEIFETLKRTKPHFVENQATALRLARAGRIADGRNLLNELANQWNATWLARQRFEFELQFGDATQAATAYAKLGGNRMLGDPLARDWLRLLRRHPLGSWSWRALLSLATLGLALAMAAAVPALVVLPVDYWSLRRERAGKSPSWLIFPWRLRTVWLVGAVGCVGELMVAWYFYPDAIRSWGGEELPGLETVRRPLPGMTCLWLLLTATAVGLLWRSRAWRFLGPGEWSLRKAIFVGLGVGLAVRLAAVVYVLAVPRADLGLGQISPGTTEMIKALDAALGFPGLLFVVAAFVPVLEEFLFRGVVLGGMAKHIPFYAANTIQAFGFAALHQSWLLAPFFFAFGLFAGLLVRSSGGLLAAIVMHACNNALACVAILVVRLRTGS